MVQTIRFGRFFGISDTTRLEASEMRVRNAQINGYTQTYLTCKLLM